MTVERVLVDDRTYAVSGVGYAPRGGFSVLADPKSGGVAHGPRVFAHPQSHHVPEVYDGIGAEEAAELLKEFFAGRRD